jgi:hypothetical protein
MKCKQLENLPVVSESQMNIKCPVCSHYYQGQCSNQNRKKEDDPCPFDNKVLPTKEVEGEVVRTIFFIEEEEDKFAS